MMLFAMGCDKIDINNTHKPFEPVGGQKAVLIKDFTGVRCVNCPAAAETAHELQHLLGEDRIFILSVHAGFLAQPIGNFPDFLTEEGTIWYNNHDSNPLFSVDHVDLTEGYTLNVEQIDAPVSAALNEVQLFDITTTTTYDEASRRLEVENSFYPTGDGNGKYYATVCLVEDSIVGWQTIPGGVNKDYVFRRDAHSGAIPFLLPAQEIKNGLCPFRRSRSIPDSCSAPLFSCLSKRKGAEKRTTQGRGRLRFLPLP